MVGRGEEFFVEWTSPPGTPLTHVRSTLLSSSLQTLKKRGHYEDYIVHLPEEHHEAVLMTLAATWLDAEHGLAHYRACDALSLPKKELEVIGNAVGERIQSTFLGTLARGARGAGVSPWLPLGQINKIWERLFQGGAVRVIKTGPKDARVEVRECPLAGIPYFRVAFVGVIHGAAAVFTKRALVRELPRLCGPNKLAFQLSWV